MRAMFLLAVLAKLLIVSVSFAAEPVFDIPDPTDGGVYRNVPAHLADAVRTKIAAKQGISGTGLLSQYRISSKITEFRNSVISGSSALDEVNAARSKRGLRPYIFDAGLTAGAEACAAYRAARGIAGHCNDFSFLPAGVHAGAAGCAAWRDGFGACAMYENWTYAGAAVSIGRDGLRYCHLFVR